MLPAFYSDNDPYCAQWLRNLIAAGEIPPGDVDERDIRDIQAGDLEGYGQIHMFAGIAGWPLALKLAGWGDRPVWTGSCPCQPFSVAGQAKGLGDERHLWPAFLRLISECRPAIVLGEQISGKLGRQWLSGVRLDLESAGYAVGAADLPAAGVGAPQIRQRLFWVADARRASDERRLRSTETHGAAGTVEGKTRQRQRGGADVGSGGSNGRLADTEYQREGRRGLHRPAKGAGQDEDSPPDQSVRDSNAGWLGDPGRAGLQERGGDGRVQREAVEPQPGQAIERSGNLGFWSDFELIPCDDGKARRVKPGIFPLAARIPAAMDGLGPVGRVGALKGAGNSISPELAAEFIQAVMEMERAA